MKSAPFFLRRDNPPPLRGAPFTQGGLFPLKDYGFFSFFHSQAAHRIRGRPAMGPAMVGPSR